MNSSSETELRRKRRRSPSSSSRSRSSSSSSVSVSKSKSKKRVIRREKHRHRSHSKEKSRNRSRSRSKLRDKSKSRSRNKSKSRSRHGRDKKKKKDKESKHSHKHEHKKDKKSKETKSKSDSKRDKESRKESKKESKSSSKQDSPKSNQNNLPTNPHFLYPGMDKNMYMRPPPQFPFRKQFPQPMEIPNMHTMQTMQSMNEIPKMDINTEGPTDKIVKDQNFLNSDEKLFETIVNHEMSLKSVFANCQLSENYLGSTLYKTIKKTIHDPNITIFDDKESGKEVQQTMPKKIEFVQKKIENIRHKTHRINFGDMSEIIQKVMILKEAENKSGGIGGSAQQNNSFNANPLNQMSNDI